MQAVKDLTKGRGVDIAIEAVGKPSPGRWPSACLRRGGTVNFFGGCPNDSHVALDTSLLHYSEITCKASFHHTPMHIRKALEAVSRGDVTARDFVNREEPLTNLLEVMRHLMSHNGHMKTAIIPVEGGIPSSRAFRPFPDALARTWTHAEAPSLYALACELALRKFPRRQLPAS